MVTLRLLSTHHPWISWQSTAGHNSVTLHSSPVDQLAEHSWSHCCYSTVFTRVSAGRAHWSHFSYSPLNTRVSAGREQLVTLLLLSIHHPWISWQSTDGHTSVTLHSSPVNQLADHSWSHFCYSPLITCGSAGRVQLVTVLLLSTHHPWISWQSTAGHNSVTLHSSPVDQLEEHSFSHFSSSPLITSGSAGRVQLVTILLLSSHQLWISWKSTAGHTAVTLSSTSVCQLAENSWSHLCYSPLITRGSAGKAQLVTLLLHSTHHPWISWQITAGHTSVTLHSSPVDQLAEYSWSHFCYSPLITRGSAGRVQLVTLLLLFTYHPWISWQSTAGYTFCYSPVITRVSAGRAHWSHFGYSPLTTRVSAGRVQLVTLLLLSTHHPWINWQSTAGHTSVTLQSSPVCHLAEHTGHTSVTLHSTPVCQLAEHRWSLFCYSPLITRGSAGRAQLVTLR